MVAAPPASTTSSANHSNCSRVRASPGSATNPATTLRPPAHAHPRRARRTQDDGHHGQHDGGAPIPDEDSPHDHDHEHNHGRWGWLRELVAPHGHDAAVAMDSELETSRKGMRALLVSF